MGILFIPYALLLRGYALLREVPTEYLNGGPLYEWLSVVLPLGQGAGVAAATALVVLQAFLLVFHTNQYKQSTSRSLLVGLVYVLLMSMGVRFLYFNPVLLGNTFLILGLGELFHIHRLKRPGGRHFNAGFWVALAALSYGSMASFLLYAILAMGVMRSFSLREGLQLCSGFAVPFVLWGTYLYYTEHTFGGVSDYLIASLGLLDGAASPGPGGWVVVFMFALLSLACALGYGLFVARQGILTRKISSIVLLFLMFGGMSMAWQSQVGVEHLQILAIPVSIFVGHLLHSAPSKFWAEAWHLLWVAILLISHWVLG